MGIREKVKSGKLTSQEALSIVSTPSYKGSPIVGWLKRRGTKTVTKPVAETPTTAPASDEKAKNKYKQKKHQKVKKS